MTTEYQLSAFTILKGYLPSIELWEHCTNDQLAELILLLHPLTTTHRIARIFGIYIMENPQLAHEMLVANNAIPELQGLTLGEKKVVMKVLLRELEAMRYALEMDMEYDSAYIKLNPYNPVYAAPIIWFSRGTGGCCGVEKNRELVMFTYEQAMELLAQADPMVEKYQEKYSIDLKIYREYLQQTRRFTE